MKYRHAIPSLLFGVLLTGAAHAGGFLKVNEFPGAVANSTTAIGISDNGLIAGSYQSSDGNTHGFYGPINGTYTAFDAGANGTQARGINVAGYITGFSNANGCSPSYPAPYGCVEFERFPNGINVPVRKNGAQTYGIIQGINSSGTFVGSYSTAPGTAIGFYGYQGAYTSEFALPFPVAQTRARAIDNHGTVVGFFFDPTYAGHGFVLKNGVATVIDYPSPSRQYTFLEGINNQGTISGSWSDALGNSHSFVLSSNLSTFTDITPPGATQVQSWNINSAGEVAVSTDIGSFIYCSRNGDRRCSSPGASAHSVAVNPATFRSYACINGCKSAPSSLRFAPKPLIATRRYVPTLKQKSKVNP